MIEDLTQKIGNRPLKEGEFPPDGIFWSWKGALNVWAGQLDRRKRYKDCVSAETLAEWDCAMDQVELAFEKLARRFSRLGGWKKDLMDAEDLETLERIEDLQDFESSDEE